MRDRARSDASGGDASAGIDGLVGLVASSATGQAEEDLVQRRAGAARRRRCRCARRRARGTASASRSVPAVDRRRRRAEPERRPVEPRCPAARAAPSQLRGRRHRRTRISTTSPTGSTLQLGRGPGGDRPTVVDDHHLRRPAGRPPRGTGSSAARPCRPGPAPGWRPTAPSGCADRARSSARRAAAAAGRRRGSRPGRGACASRPSSRARAGRRRRSARSGPAPCPPRHGRRAGCARTAGPP